jgi:hypothetical protein
MKQLQPHMPQFFFSDLLASKYDVNASAVRAASIFASGFLIGSVSLYNPGAAVICDFQELINNIVCRKSHISPPVYPLDHLLCCRG